MSAIDRTPRHCNVGQHVRVSVYRTSTAAMLEIVTPTVSTAANLSRRDCLRVAEALRQAAAQMVERVEVEG